MSDLVQRKYAEQSAERAERGITSRGFKAPINLPERLHHERDRIVVIRLTDWELRQMREGVAGITKFFRCDDDTYDVILNPWVP